MIRVWARKSPGYQLRVGNRLLRLSFEMPVFLSQVKIPQSLLLCDIDT